MAGFVPGAFSALIYGILIVGIALILKSVGPPVRGFTLRQKLESLPGALPIVAVIVIIICFVYNFWIISPHWSVIPTNIIKNV